MSEFGDINQSDSITGGTDGTIIGNVGDRLKVDTVITASNGSVPSVNSKLRYDDMNAGTGGVARGTSISTSWVDVYSYTGSGIILSAVLNLETGADWLVRMVVDGEEVFGSNGMAMNDMISDTVYDLDSAAASISPNEGRIGISSEEHDRFVWTAPCNFPIRYSSSVSFKVRRATGAANKKFQAGLIVLTKE